jgi:CheY-like chemotaxis protein
MNPKILVVDDGQILALPARGHGYDVLEARSGLRPCTKPSAIRGFDHSDLMMDDINRLRVLRRRSTQKTPIIMLTALFTANPGHMFIAGANDFIVKPFNPSDPCRSDSSRRSTNWAGPPSEASKESALASSEDAAGSVPMSQIVLISELIVDLRLC